MTYYTYRKNIIVILILCLTTILASIFNLASKPTIGPVNASVISSVIYFAYRIIFLYFFLFSVYAYISGVKGVRKLEAPIVLSILGAFLVILSFGPPIFGYFLTSDIKTDVLDKVNLVETKREALNINNISGRRLSIPGHSDPPFRCYPTPDSAIIRPPIPVVSDPSFRLVPTTR